MSTTIDRERLTPRSALRYRPVAPIMETQDIEYSKPRASRARSLQEPSAVGGHPTPTTKKHSIHWLVPVAMTMLATILLLWLLQLVWSWAAMVSDDLRYGQPRTIQIDAFVGHESGTTASHFLALNWHGRAEIIEFPGGDARKAKIYIGPQLTGPDADLIPISLQFVDRPGAHTPDMIVQFGPVEVSYTNEHGSFVLQ